MGRCRGGDKKTVWRTLKIDSSVAVFHSSLENVSVWMDGASIFGVRPPGSARNVATQTPSYAHKVINWGFAPPALRRRSPFKIVPWGT